MRIRLEPVPLRQLWSGIRAQLLLLLLPCVALMLAVDGWNDHEDRTRVLASAYDETLLEPLSVLDDNLRLDARGQIELSVPFAVQAMFESVHALHKHLHVGVVPLDGGSGAAERTLMGVSDLPLPAPGAQPAAQPEQFGATGARIVFYDGLYRGYPVRVAMLQRELQDAAGRRYRLLVQAAESTGRRVEAREASLRRELRQALGMLVVTALLVWLGIGRALRPLERLRASLRARPPHDLQPLDASQVPYEVAPLVEAVNHHIADHRQLLEQQSRFLADASHQLRTPLAIMMTQAGYAMREQDPGLLRETLRAIVAQLGRSQRLSDQLLSMAYASRAGQDPAPPPLADLNAIAREVVLQSLPLAHARNQDLGWVDIRGDDVDDADDRPAAPVRAQPAELHEALANLVHNAINHTPAGGRITVAVRTHGDAAIAEVCDSGPGLAPELREAVFERFARSAPGATGGAGLGLAIARAYVRRNGGDIELGDGPAGGPGLCARLLLPLAAGQCG